MNAALLDVGTKTCGEEYYTGLTLRGHRVIARPPHEYAHYTDFGIELDQDFPAEVFQQCEPRHTGDRTWVIGFTLPGGTKIIKYCSYLTREEAEDRKRLFGCSTFRASATVKVGYKRGSAWADKATGRPWGVTWSDKYAPLQFTLTEEEAATLLTFQEEMDAAWRAKESGWIRAEEAYAHAVAEAAALDGLPVGLLNQINGPTECLECGAVFSEPGRVQSHGMGCDRCD